MGTTPRIPLLFLLLLLLLLHSSSLRPIAGADVSAGTDDGSEQWGYVEVRPKAHMFWWRYASPRRDDGGATPWPTVLWLQGGPGSSGVGMGNFEEIGPLDVDLKPRSSTWLQKADLLFVDNPVGTGFSYVEDESLLVKSDVEAAGDLTTLLKRLYSGGAGESWQNSPLFLVGESYGGKFAVTAGLAILDTIKAGELKLLLGGIALGDSWISPEDYVFSWGPLLRDISRLDAKDAAKSNDFAEEIRRQIADGEMVAATDSWATLENFISSSSNEVDFYNFLIDSENDPISSSTASAANESSSSNQESRKVMITNTYSTYLSSKVSTAKHLDTLMNTFMRKKLKIIPQSVRWVDASDAVFSAFAGDFMIPRINEVDELLSQGVNVTVYNGQVDLICATKGTEAWIQKLKWEGLRSFDSMNRTPLYCESEKEKGTRAFLKSYSNFQFYWILGAGHFVPLDQPCISLKMIADITHSPI